MEDDPIKGMVSKPHSPMFSTKQPPPKDKWSETKILSGFELQYIKEYGYDSLFDLLTTAATFPVYKFDQNIEYKKLMQMKSVYSYFGKTNTRLTAYMKFPIVLDKLLAKHLEK